MSANSPTTTLDHVSTLGRRSTEGTDARLTSYPKIPFGRLVGIELRKMFDTRSGFWLMASIGILAVLASAAVIIFAPDDQINYEAFASAIGIPMSILLPVVAILSVTSEWSQRSGLTTFTLVPARGRVIAAKLAGTVVVGVASMLLAAGIGAIGNLVGSAIAGVDTTWGVSAAELAQIILASVLGMAIGFMLGTLIRNSAGAIVGYFVYAFILPTISGVLSSTQDWYVDIQRWVDFQYNSTYLYDNSMAASDWGYLGFTGLIWLVVPLAVGLGLTLRSEVK